jgi:hypothetical protein
MSAREAAQALGVTRRTIYRWVEAGRLPWPIQFDPQNPPRVRPRGPQPNPMARRYTHGRHTFRPREERQ